MSSPDNEISDDGEEELVAYLDGELDSEAITRVEMRLSADADYRQRLAELQKAWELLDKLPRSEPTEAFTNSTIAMVAITANSEVETSNLRRNRLKRWVGPLAAMAVGMAGIIGFSLTRAVLTDPNEVLIEELPVIENLDLYLYADDIEFVRSLDQSGLFAGGDEDDRP